MIWGDGVAPRPAEIASGAESGIALPVTVSTVQAYRRVGLTSLRSGVIELRFERG